MDFESTFDKGLIEKLGSRQEEAENLWKQILVFTRGEQVGELLKHYTDHGWKHMSEVINTSWQLASDWAQNHLSEDEVFYLFGAGCFHDLGMHLDAQRLRTLIQGNNCLRSNTQHFRDRPWCEEWSKFRDKLLAYRMDQIRGVFGRDMREEEIIAALDIDVDNLDNWRAAGEFVRLHHARMAFEFAYFGLPGEKAIISPLVENDVDSELIGNIARSHGHALREWVSFYHAKGGKPRGCPNIFFIMSLLRVGDYLQIGGDRAPKNLKIYWSPGNPVSDLEWDINQAVARTVVDDVGRITFLMASRKIPTLKHFQRLKYYFDGLSKEFDISLGIILDQHPKLIENGYPFRYRRVESDLETELVTSKLNFVAVDSKLTVSGNDLAQILVGPLYGFNELIAIRELQQNALDAVEMRKSATEQIYQYYASESDIETIVDTENRKVIVRDKGIGMNLDDVMTKLLVLGSTSKVKQVRNEVFNDGGIIRGRFGVGFLANFLLSDHITVKTRKVESGSKSYSIDIYKSNLECIEIRESLEENFGTEVTLWDCHLEDWEDADGAVRRRIDWVLGCGNKASTSSVIFNSERKGTSLKFPDRREDAQFPIRRWLFNQLILDCSPIQIGVYLNRVFVNNRTREYSSTSGGYGLHIWDEEGAALVNLQRDSIWNIGEINRQCSNHEVDLMKIFIILNTEDWNSELNVLEDSSTTLDTVAFIAERDKFGFRIRMLLDSDSYYDEGNHVFANGGMIWEIVPGRVMVLSYKEELVSSSLHLLSFGSHDPNRTYRMCSPRRVLKLPGRGNRVSMLFLHDSDYNIVVEDDLATRYERHKDTLFRHRDKVRFWRNSPYNVGSWLDQFDWNDDSL